MKKLGLILIALLIIITGCSKEKTQIQSSPTLVKAVTIGQSAKTGNESYSGTIVSRHTTNLAFQVGGRIATRYVNAGDRVEAGQVIMELQKNDVENNLRNAQGAYQAAYAQYELARVNNERYQQLYAQSAISQLQMDQMTTNFNVARATLEQSTAAVSVAQSQLEYASLVAPTAGILSDVVGEVGQVTAAGSPVATLVQSGEKEVSIAIPEQDYSKVNVGDTATITLWALPELTLQGTVREIVPVPNNTSRAYTVKITLRDAPDTVNYGMTASVSFENTNPSSITIPLTALVKENSASFVYVIRQGEAVKVPVTTSTFKDNTITITSGLQNGDVVISAGVDKITNGEKVRT